MKLPQKPNALSDALRATATKMSEWPPALTQDDIAIVAKAAEVLAEALALIDMQHRHLQLADGIITALQSKDDRNDRPTSH